MKAGIQSKFPVGVQGEKENVISFVGSLLWQRSFMDGH